MKYIIISAAITLVIIYFGIGEFFLRLKKRSVGQRLKRLTVCALVVALLASQIDFVNIFMKTGAETVAAEEQNLESGVGTEGTVEAWNMEGRTISAFAEVSDEVREQIVPVGTTLDELILPDTLEAVCGTAYADPDELGDTSDDAEEIESEEEMDSEEAEPDEEIVFDEETPDDPAADSEEKTSTEGAEGEQSTDDVGFSEEETAGQASAEDAELQLETVTVTMSEYQSQPIIEVKTLEENPTPEDIGEQPDEDNDGRVIEDTGGQSSEIVKAIEENVIIENITWQAFPAYNAFMPGEYVFTAVLPEGYTLTDGVSAPRIAVQVYGDGPLTAEQEAVMLAGLEDQPVMLTEQDVFADSPELAAEAANSIATIASVKHPGTYVVTDDNEDNAGTGVADGDMDVYMSANSKHPIEANIEIPAGQLPTQSCYIAVRTYDVDWQTSGSNAEYDKLFINDEQVGVLTGLQDDWNTSYYKVPVSYLKEGKNTIRVEIWNCTDKTKFGDDDPPLKPGGWSVNIDWIQLICDGGSGEGVEEYSLSLTDAQVKSDNVNVKVETVVKGSGGPFDTEYSIVNNKGFIYGSYQKTKVSGNQKFTITMPVSSPDGTYTIRGMLKRRSDGAVLATDSIDFLFLNGEVVLSPKLIYTLNPDTLTKQDVTIKVEVADASSFTDIKIPDSPKTVQKNDNYEFTYTYKDSKGATHSNTYTVIVDNIDKTAPVIIYNGPVTVLPDASVADVEALVRSELTVTDNATRDCQVTVSGIPSNLAQYEGEQISVTVKATDEAGNTTTKTDCKVDVMPASFALAAPTAARSGSTANFTLSSKITALGGETVTETGFVWGIMQRPTLELNNGTGKTSPAVTTKNAEIEVTATGIVDGVTYYVRAYAKTKEGTVYYSEQVTFGINAKNFGTFSIQYTSTSGSKSTFTINRAGGTDGVQTVYYRTVNGSAIGGTHFTHAAGSVTFNDGNKSKTVQVTENSSGVTAAYGSNTATKYSNADRIYQVEIYRVEGGGALDDSEANRFATRAMAKDGNYTVDRTVYSSGKSLTDQKFSDLSTVDNSIIVSDDYYNVASNQPQINYEYGQYKGERIYNYHNVQGLDTFFPNQADYLKATAQDWLYRCNLAINSTDDGYLNTVILAANTALPDALFEKKDTSSAPGLRTADPHNPAKNNISSYKDSVLEDYGLLWSSSIDLKSTKTVYENVLFPGPTKDYSFSNSTEMNINTVKSLESYDSKYWCVIDSNKKAYTQFGANGYDADIFYIPRFTAYALVRDTQEPQLLGIAPMANATYKPGDKVTVSLVFDEIVDSKNSSLVANSTAYTINTSWGKMTYAGGADTNVLYFTGTVPNDAGGTLSLTTLDCASSIKDMCNTGSTKAAGGSVDSISPKVDTTTPTVTLSNRTFANGTASMKVTATNCSTLQYVWTNSTTVPVNGWINCNAGDTLSTRQTSGKWYLHVLGTYNATGASVHQVSSVFDFGTPDKPASGATAPELTLTANNTSWAKTRTITITKTPSNGTVKLIKTPSGTASESVSGASYSVNANGTYTFILTAGGETVTKSVQVSKIDNIAPDVALREPGNTDVIYNQLAFGIDASDSLSGVEKVEYVVDNSLSAPSSGWKTVTAKSDGSYAVTYQPTSTTKDTYYIHVRATDKAGNVTTTKTSAGYTAVAASTTKPVVELSDAPTAWQKSDVVLTWTVTDIGAGSCKLVEEGVSTSKTVNVNDSGKITATKNGIYYISVEDGNGAIGKARQVVNNIDKDAPTLFDVSVTEGWAKSKTVTLVDVTDDNTVQFTKDGMRDDNSGSGIKTKEYKEPGSEEWKTISGETFTAVKNGQYSIKLTDNVGNWNTYSVNVSGIDVTAPTVSVTRLENSNTNGWYLTSPVNITVKYEDKKGSEGAASGIASVQYAFVTSKTTPAKSALKDVQVAEVGTSTISSEEDGIYYLYYKVTDNAGNITDGYSDLMKIEANVPTLTVNGQAAGQNVSTGLTFTVNADTFGPSGGYIIAAKSGTAEADAERIIEVSETEAGGGTASTKTGTYQVTEHGTYYFKMYTNAGNSTEVTRNVYKVSFDSKGGSAVPAQLVWTGQSGTSVEKLECKVVKPNDPALKGYFFDDWYTDEECTHKFDFDAQMQVKADTTLYANWTTGSFKVAYRIKDNGVYTDFTPEEAYQGYIYGEGLATLPEPDEREDGYEFSGWYLTEDCTGEVQSAISETDAGDRTFYGRWIDVEAPSLTAELFGGEATKGTDNNTWYINKPEINLTYSDNKGVIKLSAKIDNSGYETVSETGNSGFDDSAFNYTDLKEGSHTYTFRVEDEEGNYAEASINVSLDTAAPVIEDVLHDGTFFKERIIGNSLHLTIPITEKGSGIKDGVLHYILIAEEGTETDRTAVVSKEAAGADCDYIAKIAVDAEFEGIIQMTAVDYAGHSSDVKEIALLVENSKPQITVMLSTEGVEFTDWILDEETVKVSVNDEIKDHLTSGIAEVTYSIDGENLVKVSGKGFEDDFISSCDFTVDIFGKGEHIFSITALDHAGNVTTEKRVIRICEQEETPEASIDKENGRISGLVPGAEYDITYTDEDGNERTDTRTADEEGSIDIEDNWTGRNVDIRKKGNGADTVDSPEKSLDIPKREPTPSDAKMTKQAGTDGQSGSIGGLEPGETYQISKDGGESWEDVIADDQGEVSPIGSGSYDIRKKAGEDTLPSHSVHVEVTKQQAQNSSGGFTDGNNGSSSSGSGSGSQSSDNNSGGIDTGNNTESDVQIGTGAQTERGSSTRTNRSGASSSSNKSSTAQTVKAELKDGMITVEGDVVVTGTVRTAETTTKTLSVGEGAVIITVVSDEYRYTAGVADTVAVANAVLTQEQKKIVNDGETIEIRVEVKDISEQVAMQDKDTIEEGLKAGKAGLLDLTLGSYVDISMYIRIGYGDWDAITRTGDPIEVVIEIPEELQYDGGTYYIARSHEGKYTLLDDLDNEPDTITIKTELFSTYAIAYKQVLETSVTGTNAATDYFVSHLRTASILWIVCVPVLGILFFLVFWKRRKDEEEQV